MDNDINNKLIKERFNKLTQLEKNTPPNTPLYANDFKPTHNIKDILVAYQNLSNESLGALNIEVKIAGRMMLKRIMGRASFVNILDHSGIIQLFVTHTNLAKNIYEQHFKKWDIGDIIATNGILFRTKTNELSIRVSSIRLLTKSLRPLPEKFHGLENKELRYRMRYVDLIMNKKTRTLFKCRSAIISYIRNFFDTRDFLEVETPMMHSISSGASARPFVTHHNSLDINLFLRVAPELYLKRLIVGGFNKVFEINRNFRNEGLSTRHNPEFTMIEFYQAYATFKDFMLLTEELLRGLIKTICATETINYQGMQLNFSKPFTKLTMSDAILAFNPNLNMKDLTEKNICATAKKFAINAPKTWSEGKIKLEIFEKTVEEKLIQPTFITAYPAEVSPLARRNDVDKNIADRFELFIAGCEIANAFSELNDAKEQKKCFLKQVKQKEAGDIKGMYYDSDYIRALEHGMPPTAGEGIGIDRVVMLLTNSASIRDVLLFPYMRPET